MSDTWDDEDRAIARALGADDPTLGAPIEAGALAEYEAVLSHLPFEEVAPPSELEDRVIGSALARRPAAATAITGRRAHDRARRSIPRRGIAAGAMVAAAAAIVVVLAVGGSNNGPNPTRARIEPAAATIDVTRVLAEHGTRTGVLRAPDGSVVARVALDPHGQGYVYGRSLARGSTDAWLWLDRSSGPLRVGKLPRTRTVHFVVLGPSGAITGAFLTTEKPGATPATPGSRTARASLS